MNQEQKINTLLVFIVLITVVTVWQAYKFKEYLELEATRWDAVFTE
jgi:hypothetical protein